VCHEFPGEPKYNIPPNGVFRAPRAVSRSCIVDPVIQN
jgi:hypothetical protein